jgi:hypothetical protein
VVVFAASCLNAVSRKQVNWAWLISPHPMAKLPWRIRPSPADVSVNREIKRWVREYELCLGVAKELCIG